MDPKLILITFTFSVIVVIFLKVGLMHLYLLESDRREWVPDPFLYFSVVSKVVEMWYISIFNIDENAKCDQSIIHN